MTIGIGLFAYVLLFVLALIRKNHWREAAVKAAIIWAMLATFMLELLSLVQSVTPARLAQIWLVIDLILIAVIVRNIRQRKLTLKWSVLWFRNFWHLSRTDTSLVVGVMAIVGA